MRTKDRRLGFRPVEVVFKYDLRVGFLHVVRLRQVGRSGMLAISPALLGQLELAAKAEVGIEVEMGRLVVAPTRSRPRYSLADLLAECEGEHEVPTDAEWTGGGALVGPVCSASCGRSSGAGGPTHEG